MLGAPASRNRRRPAGGWRFKEPAAGIYATFVNGRMLMKEGAHTGNLPGRVLRNSHYQARTARFCGL